ncbi:MAG: type I DNA topoisomerase [Candidatus Eremiobacteraeota bacterium]|nr:type I DNA topoisomerase [Candidatus Eremiobacteraeota bacterium]
MKKPLIIVESPTKARTIKKFLPARYTVKASVGHIRDLPKSTLGVDIEHNFEPRYLTIKGKGEVIKDLKGALKTASDVYLATDPDREGEAIAWHLSELLKLSDPKRIELHEITKEAALAAIRKPHHIDRNRVDAQQARRILDRIVGYKISPLLWSKIRGGLSAGRVQSVAVKLIVEREREIEAFVPQEYWSIAAFLSPAANHSELFSAELIQRDGEKLQISNEAESSEIVADLESATYTVGAVKRREVRRNAPPPFTTSTMQQEASKRLKLRVRRTMQLAQILYEGVDLGAEGTQGLITYMRTDSTRIADSAKEAARNFILKTYGAEYHSGREHRVREGAQDAHEALRPTSVERTPEKVAKVLKRDELRLYTLIWERFVASQMSAAVFDQTTVDIAAQRPQAAHRYTFRATGSVMKFAGFAIAFGESEDENGKDRGRPRLPELSEGEQLAFHRLESKQHFTEPPPRYTEASLVKALEDNGIGRPSTYSTIVETIQARQYVTQQDRRFQPTEIGIAVNDLLAEHFPDIVDLEFTASMENDLDRVEDGQEDWVSLLKRFYGPFKAELDQAERIIPKPEFRDEPTDEVCPNCGRPMVIKSGRFGRFISCTGYPECKTTRPLIVDTGVRCPVDGGIIAERRSRKGRVFYGCVNYPKCDFVLWDRPLPQSCPCGALVVEKTKRGGVTEIECSADRSHEITPPAAAVS